MAISLQKGQKVDLTKGNAGLSKLLIGLGWDVNQYDGGSDFDLDAAAFLLGENGKCAAGADFVFYGNTSHASGAVTHMGDNLTGAGDGDDVPEAEDDDDGHERPQHGSPPTVHPSPEEQLQGQGDEDAGTHEEQILEGAHDSLLSGQEPSSKASWNPRSR